MERPPGRARSPLRRRWPRRPAVRGWPTTTSGSAGVTSFSCREYTARGHRRGEPGCARRRSSSRTRSCRCVGALLRCPRRAARASVEPAGRARAGTTRARVRRQTGPRPRPGRDCLQHRSAPDSIDRYAARPRDRFLHDATERALPNVAEQHAYDERTFRLAGAAEQVRQDARPGVRRAAPLDGREFVEGSIDVKQRQWSAAGESGLLAVSSAARIAA